MTDTTPPDVGALYLRYRKILHAVAFGVLQGAGRQNDAEDVVNDVMLTLQESSPKTTVTNWEAYLVIAVKNRARDVLKSARVRHAGGPLLEHDEEDPARDLAEEAAERIDSQREGALLWDALADLDSRTRQIVWRHKALGESSSSVAKDFGINASRVRQISLEALDVLREPLMKKGVQR